MRFSTWISSTRCSRKAKARLRPTPISRSPTLWRMWKKASTSFPPCLSTSCSSSVTSASVSSKSEYKNAQAQVFSLGVTWAFALLSPDVVAVWRCYGCRWRFAVVGLLIGFVTAAVGLSLSFCLAGSPPPACHRCQLDVVSYSEAACFFLDRTSMASAITMAEAIANAVPSATCRAGMPTSTPVQ